MADILNRFLGAIFPEDCNCIFCGKEALLSANGACEDCEKAIRKAPKLTAPPPLSGISAAFRYCERSSHPIKKLKYGKERWIARRMAEFLEIPEDWEIDLILPIPLHASRERERGFNQSALLSKWFSERISIPWDGNLLVRKLATKSQAELDGDARRKNLKGAFTCSEPDLIKGRNLLLIDDVITTGSTMAECARTLTEAGASRVYGLAVCYQADSTEADSPLYFR